MQQDDAHPSTDATDPRPAELADAPPLTDPPQRDGDSTESVSTESDPCDDTIEPCQQYVVGVGASAGGLEALEKFFASLPEESGMSFVVVQHLSPDFKSHMDQLLRRVTKLNVRVVEDGMSVEPDTIYLIPPNTEMVISNGKLLLTERSADKSLNHPIDLFFRSLAQDCQRYAIGIVLSGTGSDGSRGITEIAENEGLVIAQDPASCKFDAMPLNAQETGNVHLVLPPEAMCEAIRRYVTDGTTPDILRQQQIGQLEETGLNRVFQLLQSAHEIDFSHYKPGTVERRIQRRMELLKLTNLDAYVERLNEDHGEINELYKDLLIGVTRFFRDTEAFDHLQQVVYPKLIEQFGDEGLRIWVCGCATGEEAYSIAIGLIETYERMGLDPNFKMFATDAHKESLQYAATGVFPEAKMKDVSEQRRTRFFRKRRDGFYITADVRRNVVFAPQNIISDPPFTQMHLVTCRNLLIYLQPAAQKKALSLFHFSLKQSGVLFLGPSESPGDLESEFEPIQKSWKIYRKRRDVRLPVDLRLPMGQRVELRGLSPMRAIDDTRPRTTDVLPSLYDMVLGDLMPPSVLIDAQYQMLHSFPGSEAYLRFVPGRPTTNVLELIYPSIKNSLAAAIQHALRDGQPVRYSGMPHPTDTNKQVRLIVRPYKPGSSDQHYLLLQFETMDVEAKELEETEYEDVDLSRVAASRIEALEQDLSYTQQNLQATIEELETSNEELQATNEEMVAANEELQSTNEELHSVNEELYTVNAEHQKRVKELDEANADMNNLLATTRVGVIFLDREFYIRRFTPAIGQMLYMEQHDIGRSIDKFISRIDDSEFLERLTQVLDTRTEQEWDVTCDDSTYLVRAMPYWTGSEVAGVVISFVNIDSIKRTEAQLARFKFMADMNIDAQVLVDADARVVYANSQMAKSLGYEERELAALTVMRFDTEFDMQAYREKFAQAEQSGGEIFQSTHVRKDGTRFPVEIAITPVSFDGEPFIFSTIRDITSRRKAEAKRRLLEKAIAAVENGITISDPHEQDNPITFVNPGFTKITGYTAEEIVGENCRFLQGPETDPKAVVTIRDGLRQREPTRNLIRNYRKDGTPFWNDVYITPVRDARDELIAFVGVQNDVTQRIEASKKVEERERTIRLLLDSTAEGIYGVDLEGNCTFCNQSAVGLLGYDSVDQLIGRDMHELIHHQHADGTEYPRDECPIYLAFNNGKPQHCEDDVFWRADGSSFPVEYWSHPIMDGEQCMGAVLTFVDTTQRRNELEEIREAHSAANAANAAKSRFLANMSHELRTPLSAILGFTQIMQEENKEPESSERLETIRRNGEYLLRLLNDVLDLSRIEAGKFQTSSVRTRLDDLLFDVAETMEMRTHETGTTLKFHLKNPLPETITTDPARLRQILINLIGNAIKFTPSGRVDVTVWMDDNGEDTRNVLCLEVKDDGIGMSDAQIKNLFQPFVQADATISQRFGGTGLGLSITRRLADALHGDITVESCEGEGSCFQVRLPVDPIGQMGNVQLKQAETAAADDSPQSDDPQQPLKAKVLVADDMRDVRFIAEHFLTKAQCEVEIAENGRQAVNMVREAINTGKPYDLVMMDVQMPELDGEQAVKQLRDLGIEVPIIALTADAMKGTRRRLIAGGFDEYLTKPLDRNSLLQVARLLLRRR